MSASATREARQTEMAPDVENPAKGRAERRGENNAMHLLCCSDGRLQRAVAPWQIDVFRIADIKSSSSLLRSRSISPLGHGMLRLPCAMADLLAGGLGKTG